MYRITPHETLCQNNDIFSIGRERYLFSYYISLVSRIFENRTRKLYTIQKLVLDRVNKSLTNMTDLVALINSSDSEY